MEPTNQQNQGLSSLEAAARLKQNGPNEIAAEKAKSVLPITAEVMKEPMFFLLIACGSLYVILGNYREGIAMLSSISIIIGITFYQYRKTQKAVDALRELSVPGVWVKRDGHIRKIRGADLVVGDVLFLSEGDRVPADASLFDDSYFTIDESLLTGESIPVLKTIGNGADRNLYSGTLVVGGHGYAQVFATGQDTKFGGLGKSLLEIQDEKTPLQKELRHLIKILFFIGLGLCLLIVIAFYLSTANFLSALLNGLAAAMAIVPEEFSVVLTVFLALGAWRLSQNNVLARKPSTVETLGAINVLCADKTGTITQNAMEIAKIYVDGKYIDGENLRQRSVSTELLDAARLACAKDSLDPMDLAINRFANVSESHKTPITIAKEFGLTPQCLAVTNIVEYDATLHAFCKGAPEAIATLCRSERCGPENFIEIANQMASSGLRVIAVCHARNLAQIPAAPSEVQFEFLGLLGFEDPVRTEVGDAIRQCRDAGIRVIMITGDFPETAKSIGDQIGLDTNKIMTGAEMASMSERDLAKAAEHVNIFARVIPRQKLGIVRALKSNKGIVAMTGDGINDAPALKAADVGIAMGKRGTDVAREAASMVLTDDNFAFIVKAIRMGRRIYDNLQKAMGYILTIHIPIIVLALLPALLLGFPPLLLPLHIIFLELVIDPVSSIVFESEAEETNIMSRPPRNRSHKFFGSSRILPSILKGLLISALAFALFHFALRNGLAVDQARTEAFVGLVIANILLTVSSLSTTKNFVAIVSEKNVAAIVVLSMSMSLLAAAIAVPSLRSLFKFEFPGCLEIGKAILASLVFLAVLEFAKYWSNRNRR